MSLFLVQVAVCVLVTLTTRGLARPTASSVSLNDYDQFGSAVSGLGDLNGDGVPDLVVGAVRDDDGGAGPDAERGAVWILFSNWDGTYKAHQKISSTKGGFTPTLDDGGYFGISITPLGDLNEDGVVDLAVGAHGGGSGQEGVVWILFLNRDGTVRSHQKIGSVRGGFTGVLKRGDYFGVSVTCLGDLDGDGVADLAVGASGDGGGGGGTSRGAVWILFLTKDGTVKSHQKISANEGGFLGILDDWDQFGRSLANLGDLDEDGTTELAISAPEDDDGGVDRGAVWIVSLMRDGTVASHRKISCAEDEFLGIGDYDYFGHSVATLGDLDADGVPDLVVSAGGTTLWILLLNADGSVKAKASDPGNTFMGHFVVAGPGDMNGDGVVDLVVGTPWDGEGGLSRGAVWIVFLNAADAPSFSTDHSSYRFSYRHHE